MFHDKIKIFADKYPIIKKILYPAVTVNRFLLEKKVSCKKEVIQNLSELLCEDPIINVKEFNGKFAIDARSDLFARFLIHKSYEPELVKYCLKFIDENRDVIDVGANIGFFTVLFAKNINGKQVLSIEPTKRAIERLNRNIKLNNVSETVYVFKGVASNKNGTIDIKTIAGKEEYSSLGGMDHPSIANEKYTKESVVSTTIDALVSKKSLDPGFIKIDVEGAENLVFEGAQNVLKKYRPIILSELSDYLLKKNGSSSKEVINLIKTHDYDVFDPINPSAPPGLKDFGDVICIPKELNINISLLEE